MRYLGNKTQLVEFIDEVITKHDIQGETFADLFAGTASVGDYFKNKYNIISNDFMYYSYIISRGKLENNQMPSFTDFTEHYKEDVFSWLNQQKYVPDENYFTYHSYTPAGGRKFFSEENGIKIDGIRLAIEELSEKELITESEYYYLLGSLLGSVNKVANTSGTYEAFFEFWESRSTNDFELLPLEISEYEANENKTHAIYKADTNALVREISGDIAYIDPPYTVTQYSAAYHLWETLALYDAPELRGKTGRRTKGRPISMYSRKQHAKSQFEDLLRQLQFDHVLISYSNQGLISMEELIELAEVFAVDGKVHIEKTQYQEYQNHRSSKKRNGKKLKEFIIYFEKDNRIMKSPLNYPGSKNTLFSKIHKELPEHVGTFVDVMGGAFNVGINIAATNKVVYNEYNPFVFDLVSMLLTEDKAELCSAIEDTIEKFSLEKENQENYVKFRQHYNKKEKTPLNLFVLHMYAFQNMIRFNNSHEFNTPVGNSGYNKSLEERIKNFAPKTKEIELLNQDYVTLDWNSFSADTVFYFDPPYTITNAAYNDGKRGLNGWNQELDAEMFEVLNQLNKDGYKFMLSNVAVHNGEENTSLLQWADENQYRLIDMGEAGARYPRKEVLIVNY